MQHLSQPNEGPHDLNVHQDGAGAAQYAREHGDALLGEREGAVPASTSGA
jgi:hypothetical protein